MEKIIEVVNRPASWFGMVPAWIFDYSEQIGAEGIAIFAALCCHANKEKRCFPSQEVLVKETGCSVQTVRRRVNLMEKIGLIEVVKKGGSVRGQKRQATLYAIADFLKLQPPSHRKGSHHDPYQGGRSTPTREAGVPLPGRHPNIPKEQTHRTNPSDRLVDKSSRPDRPESVGEIIQRRHRPSP